MSFYNIVAETNIETVVTEYTPAVKRSDAYQSESQLEAEFIRLLCEQGYTYLPIHKEADLIANLRRKLEEHNRYTFSDSEWEQFFADCIACKNDGSVEKSRSIQTDHNQILHRDNSSTHKSRLL